MRDLLVRTRCMLVVSSCLVTVPSAALAESAEAASLPPELSLKRMVSQLLSANKTVRSKRNEHGIAITGIDRAEGAFQPQVTASVTNGNSSMRNTTEERVFRPGSIYSKSSTDYSVAVNKLFASGTKVEAKTTMSRFMTSVLEQQPENKGDNYRTYYGLSVTQPLARDFGTEATLAKLHMAELDVNAADLGARDTASTVTAEGILTYLELSLSQERVLMSEERIDVGNRLLAQAKDLQKQGRLPMADVWEVESSLLRYQAALTEAKQQQRERMNKLRTLLMATAAQVPEMLKATEPLPQQTGEPASADSSLRVALDKRDDYRMRRVMADREGVQLAYSKNQTLPRIDLIASYGLNGLAYSVNDAYMYSSMRDFPTWNVGFQMNFPLGENRQAKADMVTARIRQEDALLTLHALEVSIANDIDTSVGLINSAAERWVQMREVAQREEQQLDLERKRLLAGRSGMREILFREERALNARFAVVEQQIAYVRAETLLHAAQGTLLERFQAQ